MASMFKTITNEDRTRLMKNVQQLLKTIDSRDIQEVTIIAGEPIFLKSKGVLEPEHSLQAWDDDQFNFFLEHIVKETVPDARQANSDEINTQFFDSFIKNDRRSKDFAVTVKEKTLRIHAVSIYHGTNIAKKSRYCFTIRVVLTDIPDYKDLNLPELFAKSTTLTSGLVLISGHTGSGKAQPITTKIPTPSGFKKIGELKVGDYVFDRLGKPTKITGIYPQGVMQVFKVRFSDGREVLCNDEHLWTVFDKNGFETITLKEMTQRGLYDLEKNLCNYSVPLTNALQYDEKSLELSPRDLSNAIRNLEKSSIPKEYFESSVEQRYELLKGIFQDSVTSNGLVYKTSNFALAEDVQKLAWSLGYASKILFEGRYLNVFVRGLDLEQDPAFLTSVNSLENLSDNDLLDIISVMDLGYQEEQVCIMVENDEHLYVTTDYIVTHNTTTIASLVKAINQNPSMMRSILTIEDPVEYVHNIAQAVIIQRALGINTPDYVTATQDALRENVDVVVIGELRDDEAMDNAIRLAEMGKLVFATVHCNSPADAIDRIVTEFSGDLQESVRSRLSEVVVGILHQNLEVMINKKTGKEEQIPSASGFLLTNTNEQSELRKNSTRAGIHNMIKSQSFGITYLDAYKELVSKGIIEDTEENKSKLVNM